MLLALNLNFVSLLSYLDDIIGHIFFLFILTVAVSESSIGLAIVTCFFRSFGSITLQPAPDYYWSVMRL